MGGNIMKNIIVSFTLLLCVTTLNAYAENDKIFTDKESYVAATLLKDSGSGWSSDGSALNGIAKGGSGIINFNLPSNSAIPTVTDNSGSGTFFTNLSIGSAAPKGIDQKTWDAMIKALPGDPSKAVPMTGINATDKNFETPSMVTVVSSDKTTLAQYPVKQMRAISSGNMIISASQKTMHKNN
jgi:hypothetical protein